MYEGPFYLQFNDDFKIRQKEEKFQQSFQKLLKRYPNIQANFDNLEQDPKPNDVVKEILSQNRVPYDMMKAADDLCKQKQFIQALQVYNEGLKISESLVERCFLQKSRDYCIKSWAKHLFKNTQYLEAIKKFDEFSETWHGSSSFDERYEVLRWKYSALLHLKVDAWVHEALINPFSNFFITLKLK